ncbi:MAG: hypothetical protein WBP72_14210 [Rhodocyclaceae bacterium]
MLLGACTGAGNRRGRPPSEGFNPAQFAKTDIDRVAEAHLDEINAGLERLADKLYRRNPRAWKQGGQPSAQAAAARIFHAPAAWNYAELGGARDVDAVRLAFREDFRGDRVLALVGGLGGMVAAAFNGKEDFFVLDDLDPQKLYNCARNFEIAAWKLNNARSGGNALFLLSNDGASPPNLSFEREFGRMIGNLDLLAKIVADKTRRVVVRAVQSLATAVFLPVH